MQLGQVVYLLPKLHAYHNKVNLHTERVSFRDELGGAKIPYRTNSLRAIWKIFANLLSLVFHDQSSSLAIAFSFSDSNLSYVMFVFSSGKSCNLLQCYFLDRKIRRLLHIVFPLQEQDLSEKVDGEFEYDAFLENRESRSSQVYPWGASSSSSFYPEKFFASALFFLFLFLPFN